MSNIAAAENAKMEEQKGKLRKPHQKECHQVDQRLDLLRKTDRSIPVF